MLGIGGVAVCVAALSMSLVGSAGAAPPGPPFHPHPPILHVTRIVPSDRVSFDISALGGNYAEVMAGALPSFVFNSGPPGSPGWGSVTHTAAGHYCLNGLAAGPGGLTFNYPAVVSVANRAGGSPPAVTSVPSGLVQYDSFGLGCSGVGVSTYEIVR